MDDSIIEEPTQICIQDKNKSNILTVLIYIYYYEKNIIYDNKGINFNQKEKYYLIKSKWIKELKKYYSYQKISQSLDKFNHNGSNNSINLNNLSNNNLLERIKLYLNKINGNLLNKQLNANLKDTYINVLPIKNKNNFIYYSNGYIINSKIFKIFENYIFEGQKIELKEISIFNKGNNIFLPLIENTIFVTIGSLDNIFLFKGNSCLHYRNSKIFEDEKNKLLNKSFKDYIISRNCQENDLKVQNLIKGISIIGQYQKIYLNHLNSNLSTNQRSKSSKQRQGDLNIESRTKFLKINNFVIKDIRRNQTPILINSKNNLNNSSQKNSKYFSSMQKKCNKISSPKLKKINTTKNFNQNRQVRLFQNELKQNPQILTENSNNDESINNIKKNQIIQNELESLKKDCNNLKGKEAEESKKDNQFVMMMNAQFQNQLIEKPKLNNFMIEKIKDFESLKNEEKANFEKQLKEKTAQISQNKDNINQKQNSLIRFMPNQKTNYIDRDKQSQNQGQSQIKNHNSLPSEKSPLKYYKEPTLIGLNNIGATCFINSTLQCLSQISSLSNFFLKNSTYKMIMEKNIAKQNKNLPQLSFAYHLLIKELWNKNEKIFSFSPFYFMKTVEKMNPLFKKEKAGDPKDFINFFLEQIHKELKMPVNTQNQTIAQPLNNYDRKNAYQHFMNDFNKECSIISYLFFGITETTNICLFCKDFYCR